MSEKGPHINRLKPYLEPAARGSHPLDPEFIRVLKSHFPDAEGLEGLEVKCLPDDMLEAFCAGDGADPGTDLILWNPSVDGAQTEEPLSQKPDYRETMVENKNKELEAENSGLRVSIRRYRVMIAGLVAVIILDRIGVIEAFGERVVQILGLE